MQQKIISMPSQKIMVIFFIVLTLIGISKCIYAISDSGDGMWNSEQYDSSIKTTENINSKYGILMRSLNNKNTGEDVTVFCSQHGATFYTGVTYYAEYFKPTDEKIKKACKVAYFGWYSKYGSYSSGAILFEHKYEYVFTQQYIWEILGQTDATFIDNNVQQEYESYKQEIDNKINSINIQPSFSNSDVNIELGETIVLVDSNNVLNSYFSIDKTIEGIHILHNYGENTLSITAQKECNIENFLFSEDFFRNLGFIKEETIENNTSLYFLFQDNIQDQLYSMHYNEPVSLSFNLNISFPGQLELIKKDSNNNLIDGAVFNITGPNNYNNTITITNGRVIIEDLKKGIYYIKEITSPDGFLLDTNIYEIEIEENKLTSKSIINEEVPKGKIEINKIIEQYENYDKSLIDSSDLTEIKFSLTAKEDIIDMVNDEIIYPKGQEIEEYNLEDSGKLEINDLPLGVYEIKETETLSGLILDNITYEINLNKNDISDKTVIKNLDIVNKPTYLEISKTDFATEKEIEGAELELINSEGAVIDKWISTNKPHIIIGLCEGEVYELIEKNAPAGYEIAEKIAFTYNKDMNRIVMEDKPIIKEEPETEDEPINKEPENEEEPKMGDNSEKEILIGIILFSISGIVMLKIYNIKLENENINKKCSVEEKNN